MVRNKKIWYDTRVHRTWDLRDIDPRSTPFVHIKRDVRWLKAHLKLRWNAIQVYTRRSVVPAFRTFRFIVPRFGRESRLLRVSCQLYLGSESRQAHGCFDARRSFKILVRLDIRTIYSDTACIDIQTKIHRISVTTSVLSSKAVVVILRNFSFWIAISRVISKVRASTTGSLVVWMIKSWQSFLWILARQHFSWHRVYLIRLRAWTPHCKNG